MIRGITGMSHVHCKALHPTSSLITNLWVMTLSHIHIERLSVQTNEQNHRHDVQISCHPAQVRTWCHYCPPSSHTASLKSPASALAKLSCYIAGSYPCYHCKVSRPHLSYVGWLFMHRVMSAQPSGKEGIGGSSSGINGVGGGSLQINSQWNVKTLNIGYSTIAYFSILDFPICLCICI